MRAPVSLLEVSRGRHPDMMRYGKHQWSCESNSVSAMREMVRRSLKARSNHCRFSLHSLPIVGAGHKGALVNRLAC